jgi:hypothetical protein
MNNSLSSFQTTYTLTYTFIVQHAVQCTTVSFHIQRPYIATTEYICGFYGISEEVALF